MGIIYRLFRLDDESRDGVVSATSILGIIVNVFIALTKVIVGLLASSIAIVSEGVNNASDAMSSVLTLLGTKLAGKRPDEKHPFGYGRVEYFTSIIISVIILVSGLEMLINSVKRVFSPEELGVSYVSLFVIIFSAVVKFLLGTYTIRKARQVESDTLEALGVDSRNDSFVSIVTVVTAAVFILFRLNIDAYAGIFTSFLILKAGGEILFDNVSELLGQSGNHELASRIYKEIRSTKGVINAVDMMLHNYGPDTYIGTANLEIDHSKTVGEVYDFLHALQLRIMYEYNVAMVFGIYAVDNDSKVTRKLRRQIADYVKRFEHIKSYHAVYIDDKAGKLYCDLVVDYDAGDWQDIISDFTGYMQQKYPDKQIVVNIDTEFV